MIKQRQPQRDGERGMALIAALLSMTIILALGIAVVMSASGDVNTTKIQRVGEQAFFAADAGLDVARRALSQAIAEKIAEVQLGAVPYYKNNAPLQTGQFRDLQVLPPLDGTWNSTFYQQIRDRAVALATAANRATRLSQLNGTSYTVQYSPFTGSINLNAADAYNAVELDTIRYAIQVTGQASGGGSATVHETGKLTFSITLLAAGGPASRNFKFSGFGAFFDNGDTQANAPLASGTFSGPVHTNTHFAFLSSRNVAFRNVVSQVDNQIRYDDTNSTTPNHAIPTADITGIDISSEGYKKIPYVPLPANNFSQEYAVINSTGITDKRADGTPIDPPATIPKDGSGNDVAVFDSSGRVTSKVLAANLRTASNKNPNLTTDEKSIQNGVYVSSGDGSTITGAGIYVQGNVDDLQLYADTNGDQVYVITQGLTTTTVRTSYTNNNTTISANSKTATFTGVFTDKTDPANIQTGTSLFVNGGIASLRGGANGLTVKPAIAASTRLTLTAQSDITVTGDLKYANQVANLDGTSVSNINSIKNVFGIFTNDGNLNLAPNLLYVSGSGLGLEINAAVVTFNSDTSNDGGAIKGSIAYTGLTLPGINDRWRLVGSRVQSKINNIGYTYRDIFFDQRYSGGSFSPPFFPGTSYSLVPAVPSVVNIVATDAPFPTAMSWFRDNN